MRKESERFKAFAYDELIKRDKLNLDIFWLKDDALEDSANLPRQTSLPARSPTTLKRHWNNSAKLRKTLKRKVSAPWVSNAGESPAPQESRSIRIKFAVSRPLYACPGLG